MYQCHLVIFVLFIPTNVANGLNLNKTILYTHAPLVYYYMPKKYLSVCRNPLFYAIFRNQIHFRFQSDFPANPALSYIHTAAWTD